MSVKPVPGDMCASVNLIIAVQRQAITWANAGIVNSAQGKNFIEISFVNALDYINKITCLVC